MSNGNAGSWRPMVYEGVVNHAKAVALNEISSTQAEIDSFTALRARSDAPEAYEPILAALRRQQHSAQQRHKLLMEGETDVEKLYPEAHRRRNRPS